MKTILEIENKKITVSKARKGLCVTGANSMNARKMHRQCKE